VSGGRAETALRRCGLRAQGVLLQLQFFLCRIDLADLERPPVSGRGAVPAYGFDVRPGGVAAVPVETVKRVELVEVVHHGVPVDLG